MKRLARSARRCFGPGSGGVVVSPARTSTNHPIGHPGEHSRHMRRQDRRGGFAPIPFSLPPPLAFPVPLASRGGLGPPPDPPTCQYSGKAWRQGRRGRNRSAVPRCRPRRANGGG
ncbi:hypothetical protein M427DRAFT_63981 [Gonapodya prolifera JEL478]|uniref:Uncharacterized protein n=1 Tax=Gonapodya prolifera (strain JEL478) TaxID=1344416 RepID=A0A138ZYA8_GONPJ|nr:hypothetical protein M427DRAFT_63981 [Gonapodya prolifera JEL478]|eukprot:KXS09470.1 hypothetical protein M427DRAFT_63981 [Gonapodya prolifera JEL478]